MDNLEALIKQRDVSVTNTAVSSQVHIASMLYHPPHNNAPMDPQSV